MGVHFRELSKSGTDLWIIIHELLILLPVLRKYFCKFRDLTQASDDVYEMTQATLLYFDLKRGVGQGNVQQHGVGNDCGYYLFEGYEFTLLRNGGHVTLSISFDPKTADMIKYLAESAPALEWTFKWAGDDPNPDE
jgi:hypothetical protein